jgi:hypothetical protein
MINGLHEEVIVESVDVNLKTTAEGEVPDKVVRQNLIHIKQTYILKNIGVRWIRHEEKYEGERVGLYISSIVLGYRSTGLLAHTFWDVTNNNKLVSKKLQVGNFVQAECAVHLPFVSQPITANTGMCTALAFDYDDFMPNPQKRRRLLHLVKQMNINLLDDFFNGHQLKKYAWGPLMKSEVSLSWMQMNHCERRWCRQRAVTAHQPNSVLGQILVEGHEDVLKFTIQYFSICAEVVNKLKIGMYYAVESLARVGRLSLLRRVVSGRLELCGKVHFRPGSFQRVWSTVFAAIEVDNVEYLQAAIAVGQGKQVNIRGHRGITALGLAVMKDKVELVQVLLKAQAKVDQLSWGDETALCLGLQIGVSPEVIRKLIQAGANVNGQDSTGNSIRDQINKRSL